jgi:hypothetical protein
MIRKQLPGYVLPEVHDGLCLVEPGDKELTVYGLKEPRGRDGVQWLTIDLTSNLSGKRVQNSSVTLQSADARRLLALLVRLYLNPGESITRSETP